MMYALYLSFRIPGLTIMQVKSIAQSKQKWLLVNIQEEAEFECQMMNRDTWSDEGVKSIVRSHFILWQVYFILYILQASALIFICC